MTIRLLDRSDILGVAKSLRFRPDPGRSQHFLHDASVVRHAAGITGIRRGDPVVELGAGLGSVTLALLGRGADVTAVESDPVLARHLPTIVAERSHREVQRLTVLHQDALHLSREHLPADPRVAVINLPVHLTEPAMWHVLNEFPTLHRMLVIADAGLADRLTAQPGGQHYHPLAVKVRFYGAVHRYGSVPPTAWWPSPRSQYRLIALHLDQPRPWPTDAASRAQIYDLIDTAWASRRNTLRNAFAAWAGSGNEAAKWLLTASIDPARHAADLRIEDFVRLHHRSTVRPAHPGSYVP